MQSCRQQEMIISTWFYAEPEGEESTYSQVGGISSSDQIQHLYWRCLAVLFATSYRYNPGATHILFSNTITPPVVDGINIGDFLETLGVEIVEVPFTFKSPSGYYGAWRNQFYVFDIIKKLKERFAHETTVVLDSDCVWIGNAAQIEIALVKNDVLTYAYSYPPEWNINGLTRVQMKTLFSDMLGIPISYLPIYCGGEIFAASPDGLSQIHNQLDGLWDEQLNRHEKGLLKCNEEAHALTYLYYNLGYPLGTANPFIKRIWTGLPWNYRSDLPEDYGLTIWHLPAEKRWGFKRLFNEITNIESEFWSFPPGPNLTKYLGEKLCVNHRSVGTMLSNFSDIMSRKISNTFWG